MGAAMAGNLLEVEHELVVHNRTRSKAEQLISYGALVADSPREVAEVSDIIITMLPGPPEVDEVVAGEGGLLEGTGEGSHHRHEHLLTDPRPGVGPHGQRKGCGNAGRASFGRGRRGQGRHALDHGRRRR